MATIKINLTIPETNSIKRDQIRTGIVATAIHKDTGHKYSVIFNSSTSSSLTKELKVPYAGKYIIRYSNPKIQSNYNVEVPTTTSTITIYAQYLDLVTYTLCINENNRECYYLDDAVWVNNWDNAPIFQDINPYFLYNDGSIRLLNKNNIQYDDDNGNIMIRIPRFAYRIYRKNNYLYVSITNDERLAFADKRFTYDAFTREYDGDLDYLYIGAYKGYIDENNKLRSIIGVQPTANKAIEEFQAAAQANGSRYLITKYSHLKALQCLFLIRYKTVNPFTIIGKGISNVDYDIIDTNLSYITGYDILAQNGEPTETISDTKATYNKGMVYGYADGLHHMKVFGIEDFWGNIFEWIDDFTISENFFLQSGDTDTYAGLISNSGYQEDSLGKFSRVIGTTNAGFMPIEFDNTSTWNDYYGMLMKGCNLAFGGMWNMGDKVGPFCMAADVDKIFQYRSVGARLVYA